MDGREVNMPNTGSRRGGWITFTFITGAAAGLTLATGGWLSNLIVYLIQEFNVKSINAAQISNIMNGCINLFPVIGAIVADSFIGSFFVASISACISLMGIVLLELTATLDSLRPQSCDDGSSLCTPPSKLQYAILYTALALACIGCGSVSSTVIVYIEDNLSWRLGFGLSAIANFIGLAFLLLGNRFYLHVKPHGSPFTGLIRVIVATIRKRKVQLSSKTEDYYYGQNGIAEIPPPSKKRFRFLNRAALKTEGDVQWDGSVAKPWRICTMQQVEDLRNLMRILPLWSTGVFLSTPIGILSSLAILQALTMDRSFGPHFKIPSGSILVLVLIWTSISLTIIDRFLCPMWQKLTGSSPTPLQRIGVGHVLNTLSMLTSALVESKRLKIAHAHHLRDQPSSIVPMSVLWLVPQLALVGIGEAFHFPGQVALYYQEFPTSLKTTSTAMISTIIGIAYYLSTALIDLVRRVTGWLPDNLNDGRVDNVYWALVVVGVLNFGYYLMCACSYRYQNVGKGSEDAALINDADS
ncbi:protein NRT1/ PTR FAMILY 2.7-like isoform X2 [Juglans microcarpa x Juglans regia]|uniref:protein NRT1/ PTR FAMILY 2.7-like isoform X2 n=1 Tax=Juglans microcarpa x Juglans regia TaxID=2249226 RepID=UPI001B7EF7F3|nr:protein NRT1/ PTR FAMILY 2.7-like isoform X2 [Juglans microcarpa x Juglans regia]